MQADLIRAVECFEPELRLKKVEAKSCPPMQRNKCQ
jgi:hypothetical protein